MSNRRCIDDLKKHLIKKSNEEIISSIRCTFDLYIGLYFKEAGFEILDSRDPEYSNQMKIKLANEYENYLNSISFE